MIVRDLNVVGMPATPDKTNAPLFVNANAMLAGPIALQFLKAVSRRNAQFLDVYRRVQYHQLSFRTPSYRDRQTTSPSSLEDILRIPVGETLDHSNRIIVYNANSVKRYAQKHCCPRTNSLLGDPCEQETY